jgi:hypothetical protein
MADLLTLINAIPDAQDGNVITANYHNTIKKALVAIANQLGTAPGAQTVNLTVQPNFITVGGGTAWSVSLGIATSAVGSNGFISLNLPDGAVIQQMVAMGSQTNPASKGFASLLALPLSGTASTTLIQIDLSTGGSPFTLTGSPSPTVSGLTAAALANMLTVQNSQFKYAIQAEVLGAGVQINALQIVFAAAAKSA